MSRAIGQPSAMRVQLDELVQEFIHQLAAFETANMFTVELRAISASRAMPLAAPVERN